MGKEKKGKVIEFDLNMSKGQWFDPLVQNQVIEGVFTRTFDTKSNFKNSRENSDNFGKKLKTNYEIKKDNGQTVVLSETSGPLQAVLDALSPGDRLHLEFKYLALPDGTPCPKTVKTKEQLWKWRGGKKESSWPVWGACKVIKK